MPPEAEYRLISLTQGQFAKVSPHRFEELSKHKWQALWSAKRETFYACRTIYPDGWDGTRITVAMHRQILGLERGDTRQGDHRNHDTLDNTDDNLRIASKAENARNQKKQRNNTTGYTGVSLEKPRGSHPARYVVWVQSERIQRFPVTPEGLIEAAKCYDREAVARYGEFAHLNLPHGLNTDLG